MMSLLKFAFSILVTAVVAHMPALAQTFPSKPITIIVPYGAGVTDMLAREAGLRLSTRMGVPVVVDNRPGAGGIVAANIVARSKPDGYTLLMMSSAMLAVAANDPAQKLNPIKEFAPVGYVGGLASVLVVKPSLGVKTVPELLTYLKANPGTLNCGVLGENSSDYQACRALAKAARSSMEYVQYRGMGDIQTAILGDQIHMNVNSITFWLPFIKADKLRVLATVAPKRLTDLPETPTFRELGIDYGNIAHNAIFAPAATPPEVLRRLNAELAAATQDPTMVAMLKERMLLSGPTDAEWLGKEFRTYWDQYVATAGRN